MRRKKTHSRRVMGVAVAVRSLAYYVAEAPMFASEWGIRHIGSNTNAEAMDKVRDLLKWVRPDVVVLEDYAGIGSRRCARVQRLIRAIARLATQLRIRVVGYSRGIIRKCFADFGVYTKYDIAKVLANMVPYLARHLPARKRKPWESERRDMALFDAAALVAAYYRMRE